MPSPVQTWPATAGRREPRCSASCTELWEDASKHTRAIAHTHVLCFFPGSASRRQGQGRDPETTLPHTVPSASEKQNAGTVAVVASLQSETTVSPAPGTFWEDSRTPLDPAW